MTIDKCYECRFLKAVRLANHANYSWFCTKDKDSAQPLKEVDSCSFNNPYNYTYEYK